MSKLDPESVAIGRELGVAEARFMQLDQLALRIREIEIWAAARGFRGAGTLTEIGDDDDAPQPGTNGGQSPVAPGAMPTMEQAAPWVADFLGSFGAAATMGGTPVSPQTPPQQPAAAPAPAPSAVPAGKPLTITPPGGNP